MTESTANLNLPAPPVPADCDLREMPFAGIPVRWLRDSVVASVSDPESFRAAILLWCEAWHQMPAGSLPSDDASLRRLAGCGSRYRAWLRAKEAGALNGWERHRDGRLYHPVMTAQVIGAWSSPSRTVARVDRRLQMLTSEWAALRRQVFQRDDYTCVYCNQQGGQLECEHVLALAKGGLTAMDNLATACPSCNRSKGARPLSAWRRA